MGGTDYLAAKVLIQESGKLLASNRVVEGPIDPFDLGCYDFASVGSGRDWEGRAEVVLPLIEQRVLGPSKKVLKFLAHRIRMSPFP